MITEKIINYFISENLSYKMVDSFGEITVDKNRAQRFLLEEHGILVVNNSDKNSIDIFFKKRKNNIEILKKISKSFRFLFITSNIFIKIHKIVSKKKIVSTK